MLTPKAIMGRESLQVSGSRRGGRRGAGGGGRDEGLGGSQVVGVCESEMTGRVQLKVSYFYSQEGRTFWFHCGSMLVRS